MSLLSVRQLRVALETDGRRLEIVRGISFDVDAGGFHALVGDTFLDLVLVRLEIDFKAEIPMGTEEVLVTCRATGIGRTSMRTQEQILLPGGTLAAQSETVIVARDATTRSSRPWTDEERAILDGAL